MKMPCFCAHYQDHSLSISANLEHETICTKKMYTAFCSIFASMGEIKSKCQFYGKIILLVSQKLKSIITKNAPRSRYMSLTDP